MPAGSRDTLVTIERATAVQDAYGEETQTWAEHAIEWAAVYWGRGDERRQAAAEQGSQAATFQMLSNNATRDVTIRDRIRSSQGTFNIVGIAPDTPSRGLVELTAVRAL